MKFLRVLCLATILSVAPAGMIVAQSTAGHFIHTVTKGQSLYSISSMYNVSIADIVKENPGSDAGIKVGQSLKIPQNGDNQVTFHTIQSGETLYKLSVKYGVSVERICQANPGLSAKNFRVDQVIAIPPVAKSEQVSAEVVDQLPASPAKVEKKDESLKPNCRDMHRVERKETVYSICKQYGITEEELLAANPEIKNKKLKKGKFLCIPYPKETATTATPIQPQTNVDAT